MAKMFPLWGQGDGLSPGFDSDEQKIMEYVNRCANHGVTRLIPGGSAPLLVEIGHQYGLEVDTYRAVNAYGANKAIYETASEYDIHTMRGPEARGILDRHRPIYSVSGYEMVIQDEFARVNRGYWNKTREGDISPLPNERLSLSFGFSEVRQYEADIHLGVHRDSKSDGLQLEFVIMNTDDDGVNNYGYEDPVIKSFKDKYAKDPFTVVNDDADWLQHRSDYVTLFVSELRDKLKDEFPDSRMSATLIAGQANDYLKAFQDWSAWLDGGLMDEFYLWFRTTSDIEEIGQHTGQVADIVNGRVPFIVELSCYHLGSPQDPVLILESAKRARGNGADAVGLYRSHAVEQLNLWNVVEQIRSI